MPNPNAVWVDILNLVQTTIQNLGLVYTVGGIDEILDNGSVYIRKVPSMAGLSPTIPYPNIQICLQGREELPPPASVSAFSFETQTVGYNVLVLFLFQSNALYTLNNDELYWRQQIIDTFLDRADTYRNLLTSAALFDIQIDTMPALDPTEFHEANVDVGAMVLKWTVTRAQPGR
jgi:hypothetical protein